MNKLSLIKPFIKTNVFDKCFISSITDDSRDVQKNSLFVARQGVASHGKEFVKESSDLREAIATINTLRSELNEVNLLNAKLLYVNKSSKLKIYLNHKNYKLLLHLIKVENGLRLSG